MSGGPARLTLRAFAKDYARRVFAAAGVPAEDWSSVVHPDASPEARLQAIDRLLRVQNVDVVITGVSDNDDLTHQELWHSTGKAGIWSVAFLDSVAFAYVPDKTNLRRRFVWSTGELVYPDELYVVGEKARASLEEVGIPPEVLFAVTDVHLERFERLAKNVPAGAARALRQSWSAAPEDTVILFASEPMTEMRSYGNVPPYDEFGSLDALIRRVEAGECLDSFAPDRRRTAIVVRPHPRDRAGKYAGYVRDGEPRVVASGAGSSAEAIMASDLVAGMTSQLLEEASLLGKPIFRLVDFREPKGGGAT